MAHKDPPMVDSKFNYYEVSMGTPGQTDAAAVQDRQSTGGGSRPKTVAVVQHKKQDQDRSLPLVQVRGLTAWRNYVTKLLYEAYMRTFLKKYVYMHI